MLYPCLRVGINVYDNVHTYNMHEPISIYYQSCIMYSICMYIFNNKNICWVKGIVRALQQKYISLTQNASVEN